MPGRPVSNRPAIVAHGADKPGALRSTRRMIWRAARPSCRPRATSSFRSATRSARGTPRHLLARAPPGQHRAGDVALHDGRTLGPPGQLPGQHPPADPLLEGRRGPPGHPHPVGTTMPAPSTGPGRRLRGVATPAPNPVDSSAGCLHCGRPIPRPRPRQKACSSRCRWALLEGVPADGDCGQGQAG